MNRIPPVICPWCRSEFPENGPVPAAPICHACYAVLRILPSEMLAEMLVYLVGYSQVALQVLLEANDSIKDLASGVLSRRNAPQPQNGKPQAPETGALSSKRSIA